MEKKKLYLRSESWILHQEVPKTQRNQSLKGRMEAQEMPWMASAPPQAADPRGIPFFWEQHLPHHASTAYINQPCRISKRMDTFHTKERLKSKNLHGKITLNSRRGVHIPPTLIFLWGESCRSNLTQFQQLTAQGPSIPKNILSSSNSRDTQQSPKYVMGSLGWIKAWNRGEELFPQVCFGV